MLKPGDKKNFETLKRAFEEGDVCLVECKDKKTGAYVATICAAQWIPKPVGEEPEVSFIPLAKLFEGNPYDELLDPVESMEKERTDDTDNPQP